MRTGTSQVFEEQVPRAGKPTIYLTSKAPWLDRSGSIVGVSGISRDITERKALEARDGIGRPEGAFHRHSRT